jgi:hypothetical protein
VEILIGILIGIAASCTAAAIWNTAGKLCLIPPETETGLSPAFRQGFYKE